MKKAIEYDIHGLKCDSCDFKDENIRLEDYPEWVNAPCPKCGSNLLTEQDFHVVQMMVEMTNDLNKTLPPREEQEPVAKVDFLLNGTGNVWVKNNHS